MKEKSERSKKWKFHLSKELESNILIIKLEDRNYEDQYSEVIC